MSTSQEELTLQQLAARLGELEQANVSLEQANTRLEHTNQQITNELKLLRSTRHAPTEKKSGAQLMPKMMREPDKSKTPTSSRRSRRRLLRQGLGVAAAVVGAGALMEVSAEQALASGHPQRHRVSPNDNPGNFSSSVLNTPAVLATGTNGADGVDGNSDSGIGVYASSSSFYGVYAFSDSGEAIYASSNSGNAIGAIAYNGGYGVSAYCPNGVGVSGSSDSSSGMGVFGYNSGSGYGVYAQSGYGYGLFAKSTIGVGVHGESQGTDGISGLTTSAAHSGVYGNNTSNGIGVAGYCSSGIGVKGYTSSGTGVYAQSNTGKALVVNGHMRVQGNAVGQATLPAGQTSVTVTTSAATTSSNIVLTALNNYSGTVWVTRAAGSFTINISAAPSSNVVFTYLIIN